MSDTVKIPLGYDKEKTLDWITGLFPLCLMAVFYFRWQAVGLLLLAVAGYLAAAILLDCFAALPYRPASALMTGVTVALFFPATAPLWAPALAGGIAAMVYALPRLVERRRADSLWAQDLLVPAAVGCLLVRCVFPASVAAVTLPVQWMPVGETIASPLATLRDPDAVVILSRLFLGIRAGAVGEGCVPVLVLAFGYLLLRRRVRLVAPGVMLLSVFLLSWMVWGRPTYSLLCGGVLLGALLLADATYCPGPKGEQAVAGLVAGVAIVVTRLFGGDGTTLGVVLGCGLAPLYPGFLRLCRRAVGWLWRQARRYWPSVRAFAVALFTRHIPRFFRWIVTFVREKITKTEK